jgi:hypothetical protein
LQQSQSAGKVGMRAYGFEQQAQFGAFERGPLLDFVLDHLLQPRIAVALATHLGASDVVLDLLDHREMLGEPRQADVGRIPARVGGRRALRDQIRVDRIALRPLEFELGVGLTCIGWKTTTSKPVARKSSQTSK